MRDSILDDALLGHAIPAASFLALYFAGAGWWALLVYAHGGWEYARGLRRAYKDAAVAIDKMTVVLKAKALAQHGDKHDDTP